MAHLSMDAMSQDMAAAYQRAAKNKAIVGNVAGVAAAGVAVAGSVGVAVVSGGAVLPAAGAGAAAGVQAGIVVKEQAGGLAKMASLMWDGADSAHCKKCQNIFLTTKKEGQPGYGICALCRQGDEQHPAEASNSRFQPGDLVWYHSARSQTFSKAVVSRYKGEGFYLTDIRDQVPESCLFPRGVEDAQPQAHTFAIGDCVSFRPEGHEGEDLAAYVLRCLPNGDYILEVVSEPLDALWLRGRREGDAAPAPSFGPGDRVWYCSPQGASRKEAIVETVGGDGQYNLDIRHGVPASRLRPRQEGEEAEAPQFEADDLVWLDHGDGRYSAASVRTPCGDGRYRVTYSKTAQAPQLLRGGDPPSFEPGAAVWYRATEAEREAVVQHYRGLGRYRLDIRDFVPADRLRPR